MATLGAAIVSQVQGLSDAEKIFRPWWDTLQDQLIYGLVMIGKQKSSLNHVPTPIF